MSAHRPHTLSRRQAVLAIATLLPVSTSAMNTATPIASPSIPSEVHTTLEAVRLIGQGALRFFGLLVYEARLWAPASFQAEGYDKSAFALELQYARKLDGPAIAERSIAEMERVGAFTEGQSKAWLAHMTQAFPSVQAQDRLTGVHDGRGGVRFYFNGKQTAAINDKEFARLFFGNWLSPRTSAPALRSSLLGQK